VTWLPQAVLQSAAVRQQSSVCINSRIAETPDLSMTR
jgi:hypothetical protein